MIFQSMTGALRRQRRRSETVTFELAVTPPDLGVERERIVAIALDLSGLILSRPAPARHSDLMALVDKLGLPTEIIFRSRPGFMTSSGRFVNRVEASKIARSCGQIEKTSAITALASQHVW